MSIYYFRFFSDTCVSLAYHAFVSDFIYTIGVDGNNNSDKLVSRMRMMMSAWDRLNLKWFTEKRVQDSSQADTMPEYFTGAQLQFRQNHNRRPDRIINNSKAMQRKETWTQSDWILERNARTVHTSGNRYTFRFDGIHRLVSATENEIQKFENSSRFHKSWMGSEMLQTIPISNFRQSSKSFLFVCNCIWHSCARADVDNSFLLAITETISTENENRQWIFCTLALDSSSSHLYNLWLKCSVCAHHIHSLTLDSWMCAATIAGKHQ